MRTSIIRISALVLILLSSASVFSQGVWRWDVKVLKDDKAKDLKGLNTPFGTTITDQVMRMPFKKLSPASKNEPRHESEDTVYTLDAYFIGYKYEGSDDGDYHIVLQDMNTGRTIVTEIPDFEIAPASTSTYVEKFKSTWTSFEEILTNHDLPIMPSKFQGDTTGSKFRIPVRITGVGFWDLPGHKDKAGNMVGHGKGSAVNGREIHPILSIVETGAPAMIAEAKGIKSTPTNTSGEPMQASVSEILSFLLLTTLLGMAGQMFRVVVGLKKVFASKPEDLTSKIIADNSGRILFSLLIAAIIGGLAGILAGVSANDFVHISKPSLFAFIGVGYAGTDFIEGFVMKK